MLDNTQYDEIGARYENMNDLPAHAPLVPTVDSLIGSIKGLRILDLACGSGHWSRILADMGAASVVGVDVSEGMIKDALKTSESYSNIEYRVADCTKPLAEASEASSGQYDMVFAAWFLNYAGSTEELLGMWHNVHCNLKEGGRLVAIVPNLENDLWEPLDPRYGTYLRAVRNVNVGQLDEGQFCHMIASTEPPIEFDCYKLSKKAFEQTAKTAGLKDLEWHYPIMPAEGWPDHYWDVYEERPHFLVCMARRPGHVAVGSSL